MMKRRFFFSKHYREDKSIDVSLAVECVSTGRKELDEKPNKFRSTKKYKKGELVVIWKEHRENCFVITAYWKK